MGIIDDTVNNVRDKITMARGDLDTLDIPARVNSLELQVSENVDGLFTSELSQVNILSKIGANTQSIDSFREFLQESATVQLVEDTRAQLMAQIPTIEELNALVSDIVPDVLLDLPSIGARIPLLNAIQTNRSIAEAVRTELLKIRNNVGASTFWTGQTTLNDYLNDTFALAKHIHGDLTESIDGLLKISDLRSMIAGFDWGTGKLSLDGIANALNEKITALDFPNLDFRFGLVTLALQDATRWKLGSVGRSENFATHLSGFWLHLLDYESMFKWASNPLKNLMERLSTVRRGLHSAQLEIKESILNVGAGLKTTRNQLDRQAGFLNDDKGDPIAFGIELIKTVQILNQEISRQVINLSNVATAIQEGIGEISDSLGDIELASENFKLDAIKKLQW